MTRLAHGTLLVLCGALGCAANRPVVRAPATPAAVSVTPAPVRPKADDVPASAKRPVRDPLEAEVERMAGVIAKAVGRRTVAVLDIATLQGQVTELGRYVSEQLTTDIVRQLPQGGKVVERTQIQQVLKELKLVTTTLNPDEQEKLGKALGADAIVLGTMSIVGNRVTVNARLVGIGARDLLVADRFAAEAPPPLLALGGISLSGSEGSPASAGKAAGSAPPAAGVVAPAAPAAAPAPTKAFVVEESGIRVGLDSCRRAGSRLSCAFRVTSLQGDGRQSYFDVTVYDMEGAKHEANLAVDARGRIIYRDSKFEMIGGVPLGMVWSFEGYPADGAAIAQVRLSGRYITQECKAECVVSGRWNAVPIAK